MRLARSQKLPIVLAFAACSVAASSAAHAATISVTTPVDQNINSTPDGGCSLREAVSAANDNVAVDTCPAGDPGLDHIEVPTGTFPLQINLANDDANIGGDIDITEPVSIVGLGATHQEVVIDGRGFHRIFHVLPGGALRIERVWLDDGEVEEGELPAAGGAILSAGPLTIVDSRVEGGVFGPDADGVRGPSPDGGDAVGGAIHVTAPLVIVDSRLRGAAIGGDAAAGGTGGDGIGGCIYATSSVEIRGGDLQLCDAIGGRTLGVPSGAATGGGLYLTGTGTIEDTNFQGTWAEGYPVARGGAIHVATGASLDIARSAFIENYAHGLPGEVPDMEGGIAFGGAISHGGTALSVADSTFYGNRAIGGRGADGPIGAPGGEAVGGAIVTQSLDVAIRSTTFRYNFAAAGDGGDSTDITASRISTGGPGGSARGGDLGELTGRHSATAFLVGNSIFGGSFVEAGAGGAPDGSAGAASGPACGALTLSQLGNVESPGNSCTLSDGAGDLANVPEVDLDLDESAFFNGGPTRTIAVGPGSVAIDFAVALGCAELDQRGFYRGDGTCDSGALDTGAVDFGGWVPVFDDGFSSGDLGGWDESFQQAR